jgi:hypothetical protein
MATSGSTDYTIDRDAIIRQALLNLRKTDPRVTVATQDTTDCAIALNLMIKAWQTDGTLLWLNEEVCLHLEYGKQFYALGPSGDHCGLLSDCFKTQLAADAAAAAATITVDDDDDIEDADQLLIELDDGTIQETTVDGAPASNVVTPAAALTSAASEDNWVFTYTTKISRPLKILEARVRDTDDVDTPLYIHDSRVAFMSQTDKETTGRTLEVYYNPDITNGQLYVWPVAGANDITDRIVMTVQRVIEDFDAANNNFDGPPEALAALVWGLSAWVAPQYGVDLTSGKGSSIAAYASMYYRKLKQMYSPCEPVYLRP